MTVSTQGGARVDPAEEEAIQWRLSSAPGRTIIAAEDLQYSVGGRPSGPAKLAGRDHRRPEQRERYIGPDFEPMVTGWARRDNEPATFAVT
jgi:hypothetical protein